MASSQSAHNNDWFNAQKQYWDTWFNTQRNFFAQQNDPQGPWTDFFKEWQSAVSAGNLGSFQQVFARAGENYMGMLQQFYQGTGQSKSTEEMTREWLAEMQKLFTGAARPFDMSSMDPMGFFASMPGIGYTREKQEDLNRLYREWAEYERKSREYTAAMSKVGMEALQKFQEFLSNPPKDAEPLKSLKEVYAKWVDVCEDIYARYAMSEEYTEMYGEVVNALMAFKKQQNKIIDDMADQFNLPTRQEVDSLHKQVHDLKRELAALKKGTPRTEKSAAPKKPKGKKA